MEEERKGSHGEHRGVTSKDKGHSHDYFLERMTGDGSTSKIKGHIHEIKAMVVIEANGHGHELKT